MYRVWSFFIRKYQFSYLLMIALVAAGAFSAVQIQKESNPEVEIPVGTVVTTVPGASSADVESQVTTVIEDQLAGNLESVDQVTSVSRQGISSITVEFGADANLDQSIQELKDEVDRAVPELPDDAEDPRVSEVSFVDQPVMTIAVTSDISQDVIAARADDIESAFERIQGVSRVEIRGQRDRETSVVLKRSALEQFDVTPGQVSNAIRQANRSAPVGDITVDAISYAVQYEGDIDSPQKLRDVVVTTRQGQTVTVGDIATIVDGFEETATLARLSIAGSEPTPALSIDVFKRQGADVTAVSDRVRSTLAELTQSGSVLSGFDTSIVFDTGRLVRDDLINLTTTGLQTVGLVLIVLLITLGWRESLIASAAVPLSFLVAFIALLQTGNTINFISLFSLILAVGILVDSAIVMVEGIHSNMKEWMDKREAALKAIQDYHWPLTAGTLTTVAVFIPLFTISGVTGEFIASIPFTIIFVLLASLLVALGFIPLIASTILRRRITSRMEERQEAYTQRVRKWYAAGLDRILGHRRRENVFLAGVVCAFVAALSLPVIGVVGVEFFPQDDTDQLFIEIEHPVGTSRDTTDATARSVADIVQQEPSVDSFITTVGISSAFMGGQVGERYASFFLNLNENRERSSSAILEDLQQQVSAIEGADVRVNQPSGGPPTGAPVSVKLFGEDLGRLEATAHDVADVIRSIDGTRDVNTSASEGATEIVIELDRSTAAAVGVAASDVAQALQASLRGSDVTTIRTGNDDIDVVVRTDLNRDTDNPHRLNHTTIDALRTFPLTTASGTSVPLGSVASISLAPASARIEHEDGRRVVTVSSQLSGGATSPAVVSELQEKLAREQTVPSGIDVSYGGETEESQQAFQDMFVALIMGLAAMMAVLVLQFNSLRYALYILSVAPFSLIGIFVGLAIFGKPVSFPAMMGFIALSGIVVNNAIILIDVMNNLRASEPDSPLHALVIRGATSRLRPVLLTTVTTIIGVIPLSFVSALWAPLAIAIMSGLITAAGITLILIPVIYHRWPGTPEAVAANTNAESSAPTS